MNQNTLGGRTLLSALFLLLSTNVFAQPEVEWHYVYGHIEHGRWQTNECWGLCRTFDGGFALAGEYWERNREEDYTIDHIFIMKTDSAGETLWNSRQRYENLEDQVAINVTQSNDSGYIVVGYAISGFALKINDRGERQWFQVYNPEKAGMFRGIIPIEDDSYLLSGDDFSNGDIWLLKINEDGEVIWSNSFGGEGRQWGGEVIQTADGGYAIGGGSGQPAQDGWEGLVLKVDSEGNEEWISTFGTEMNDETLNIVQTPDGGYAVAGVSIGERWYPSMFRLDSNGELIWSQVYNNIGYNFNVILNSSLDNGFILGGCGTGGVGQNPANFLILHVDSNGDIIWRKYFAGVSSNGITGIIELEDHSFVAAGTVRRPWIQGESATDAFTLLKTTPDPLSFEPAELSSSPSHDFGETFVDSFAYYELAITNSGRRYADILGAEVTQCPVIFAPEYGDIPRLFPGDSTALRLVFSPDSAMAYEGVLSVFFGADTVADTLQIDLAGTGIPNVGVREDEKVGQAGTPILLSVSPNPFNSTLTIRYGLDKSAPTRLTIHDISGREVANLISSATPQRVAESKTADHRGSAEENSVTWDASTVPAGVYFVRLNAGQEIVTQKVVLIR